MNRKKTFSSEGHCCFAHSSTLRAFHNDNCLEVAYINTGSNMADKLTTVFYSELGWICASSKMCKYISTCDYESQRL